LAAFFFFAIRDFTSSRTTAVPQHIGPYFFFFLAAFFFAMESLTSLR
jgi:hypothetical protein